MRVVEPRQSVPSTGERTHLWLRTEPHEASFDRVATWAGGSTSGGSTV